MPRDVDAGFTQDKNSDANMPLWLYRVSIDDDPANDLYLTDWYTDVDHLGQIYKAFPIGRGGLSENTHGQLDSLQINLANESRESQYFIEKNNGLRGRRVVIRQTFFTQLSNPTGYIEDLYYIDTVSADEKTVSVSLASRLDVLGARIPSRRYVRDYCPWRYKNLGCWISSDTSGEPYVAPEGFLTGAGVIHTAEVSGWLFGPSTVVTPASDGIIYNASYTCYLLNSGEINKITGSPANGVVIALKRNGTATAIVKDELPGIAKGVDLHGSDDEEGRVSLDEDEEYIILQYSSSVDQWEEITSGRQKGSSALSISKPVYVPGFDQSTMSLKLEMKCDHPERLTGNTLKISSDQTTTDHTFTKSISLPGLTTTYTQYTFPLSGFSTVGSAPDFNTGIQLIEWIPTASGMVNIAFRNVRIEPLPDTCDKRLTSCKLHNNVARFGGFPNVPSWRSTRV